MDIIDHRSLDHHFDKEVEKKVSKKQTWITAGLLVFNIVAGSVFVDANTIGFNFLLMLLLAVFLTGVSFAVALVIAAVGLKRMSFKKRVDFLVPRIYITLLGAWAVFTLIILVTALIR